jgi:hypothetical protein
VNTETNIRPQRTPPVSSDVLLSERIATKKNMEKQQLAVHAKARVQLTVEVEASSWGGECSIGQLYKQAAESARGTLIAALKPGEHGRVTIIGEPKVIGIITEAA